MTTPADFRRFYAEYIVRSGGSTNQDLIDAFAAVPREDFVGPGPWQVFLGSGYMSSGSSDPALLYQDILVGLAPERGINNGQPSLHARCLGTVPPSRGQTAVHIGAGTGYYTAILATLVGPTGHVIAFEREADLATRAMEALRPYRNVEVHAETVGDQRLPRCDFIYVNAGATHPPASWLDALSVGGHLVFPLTPDQGLGVMLAVTRRDAASFAARALSRVAFIPCFGGRDPGASASLAEALRKRDINDIRALHRGTTPDETAWCAGRDWWLSTAPPAEAAH